MLLKQYHVTALSNFIVAYDKYTRKYDKEKIAASTYPNVFFLLDENNINVGVNKAIKLLNKLSIVGNKLVVIETEIEDTQLKDNELTGTGLGKYIESTSINVSKVYYFSNKDLKCVRIEDVVAESFNVLKRVSPEYNELVPRSVSVLPVANGCQAKCEFCFSSASISREQKQSKVNFNRIDYVLNQALLSGATRVVVTGGGEPGILPFDNLNKIISLSRKYFDKVVLITNGYFISSSDNAIDKLTQLSQSGLSVLAISRHHYNDAKCESIMKLQIIFSKITTAFLQMKSQLETSPLRLRLICVLQKGGVDSVDEVEKYIEWAISLGIEEVCFKELYVSSSTESLYYEKKANTWSYENQVPLSMLTKHIEQQGWTKLFTLPWGSQVYRVIKGNKSIQVALYTEPSISWELENKLCRSWNLMSDGRCYASLETMDSQILIPE